VRVCFLGNKNSKDTLIVLIILITILQTHHLSEAEKEFANKCIKRLESRNEVEREEDSFQTEATFYQAQA
jgi:hypothetical protein